MKTMKEEHVIWSNLDLDINNGWRHSYMDHLQINHITDKDPNNEEDITNYMIETNFEYLDDERCNLNKILDQKIVCIANLELWDGSHSWYRILTNNLNSIFDIGYFEYAEFYSDGKDIRGKEIHRDGENHYLFRKVRPNRKIGNFLEMIYAGMDISDKQINYYTESLQADVANIYGW